MKNLLTLFFLTISLFTFSQVNTKNKNSNVKEPGKNVEFVQCVRPAGGGDPVCTTVDKCGKVGSKTDRGGTITSCERAIQINTQFDNSRGVQKKINSITNTSQQKMMHCKKNSNGSLSDCYTENGKCSDVIWADGFVCKDILVQEVQQQKER